MASRERKNKKDVTEIDVTMASRGKKKKKTVGAAETEDKEISATVDLDVFDCPICFEPLQPPLFQCQYGHVACSSCCPYAADGCKEIICYANQLEHKERCISAPCVCPVPNCTFSGSTKLLLTHVEEVHEQSPLFIRNYDYSRSVTLNRDAPFHVVVGPDGDVFLLLVQKVSLGEWNGNSLSMVCISPQASEAEFEYELLHTCGGGTFDLKAPVTNVKEWKGCHPTDIFLLVPEIFYVMLTVIVRINKVL